MSMEFSPKITGDLRQMNAGFSAASVELGRHGAFTSPVLHIDHFRMADVTFAPHPHAGFSAISYIFDDSPGAIRNRDSLGNDFVVGAGGIVWTQAGSGVVHDELPDVVGQTVHGLQIFINLSAASKQLAPAVFHQSAGELPSVLDAKGNQIKVVVGRFGQTASPLIPAEPVNFLDVLIDSHWELEPEEGHSAVLYIAEGEAQVSASGAAIRLPQYNAVGVRGHGTVQVTNAAEGRPLRLIIISGRQLDEPVAQYGPFVMNSREQLQQAFQRYEAGAMGKLQPLPRLAAN